MKACWTEVALGDVCEVVSGGTPKTSVADYWEGDVLWATPKDLSEQRQRYIRDTARSITAAGLAASGARVLPAGSVLLSSRAPIGLVAINHSPMATNQGFKSLVPDGARVDAAYLAHWLAANTAYLQSLGTGATFKEVSKRVVEKVTIPLPPLDEQCRIARILDLKDILLSKRRAAITQLDNVADSVFADMFGDPVANPRGWPNPTLGELLKFQQYGPRFHNATYATEGTRIIRITDLNDAGDLEFSQMPRLTVTSEDRSKYALQSGDLIFARSGATVGKVALIPPDAPTCIAGAYFITMRFDPAIEPRYARAVLTSPSVRAIVASQSRQSAQQNFSGPALRRLPMPLPPADLQRHFVDRMLAIEGLRKACRASMSGLEALSGALESRAFRKSE